MLSHPSAPAAYFTVYVVFSVFPPSLPFPLLSPLSFVQAANISAAVAISRNFFIVSVFFYFGCKNTFYFDFAFILSLCLFSN